MHAVWNVQIVDHKLSHFSLVVTQKLKKGTCVLCWINKDSTAIMVLITVYVCQPTVQHASRCA